MRDRADLDAAKAKRRELPARHAVLIEARRKADRVLERQPEPRQRPERLAHEAPRRRAPCGLCTQSGLQRVQRQLVRRLRLKPEQDRARNGVIKHGWRKCV